MNTASRVQRALSDFHEPRNLQIGQFVDHKGSKAKVLGVGIIDYQPGGPAYEVVEVEYVGDGTGWPNKRVLFSVDLSDWQDEDDLRYQEEERKSRTMRL